MATKYKKPEKCHPTKVVLTTWVLITLPASSPPPSLPVHDSFLWIMQFAQPARVLLFPTSFLPVNFQSFVNFLPPSTFLFGKEKLNPFLSIQILALVSLSQAVLSAFSFVFVFPLESFPGPIPN